MCLTQELRGTSLGTTNAEAPWFTERFTAWHRPLAALHFRKRFESGFTSGQARTAWTYSFPERRGYTRSEDAFRSL